MEITDESVLYLNEDKRKARTWFHVCGNLNVPLNGTKYGLIRRITFDSGDVKGNFSQELESIKTLRRQQVERAAKAADLGEQGAMQAVEFYDGEQNPIRYMESFMAYYEAEANGTKIGKVKAKHARALTEGQRFAAYLAGQQDAGRIVPGKTSSYQNGTPAQMAMTRKALDKYTQFQYNEDGTIMVTDDWTGRKKADLPKRYKPFAVVDTLSRQGRQRDRTIYGSDGVMILQVHGGDHGQPKHHPYGDHGKHIHDVTWPEGQEHADRTTKSAQGDELIHHRDILGGETDDG